MTLFQTKPITKNKMKFDEQSLSLLSKPSSGGGEQILHKMEGALPHRKSYSKINTDIDGKFTPEILKNITNSFR